MTTDSGEIIFTKLADPGEDITLKHALADLATKLAADPNAANPTFEDVVNTYFEEYVIAQKLVADSNKLRFPKEPPNVACLHAVLTGILFNNIPQTEIADNGETQESRSDRAFGTLIPMFVYGCEKAFVWDHQDSNRSKEGYPSSSLIVEVEESVKAEKVWRTLAQCFSMALCVMSRYEDIPETEYRWIYYFDPATTIGSNAFMDPSHASSQTFSGRILSYSEVYAHLAYLELLQRDEKYYVAVQNLMSSYSSHWFCTICALSDPDHRKMHKNREPEIWERAADIPRMDVAVVQATRAAEALLGMPSKADAQPNSRLRKRWSGVLNLDPDAIFSISGISYIEFYVDMYEDMRNAAAHSRGTLPYPVSRERILKTQCFAFILQYHYFEKNGVNNRDAAVRLRFNYDLLRRRDQIGYKQILEYEAKL